MSSSTVAPVQAFRSASTDAIERKLGLQETVIQSQSSTIITNLSSDFTRCTVIEAATASGKSTLLPQFCAEFYCNKAKNPNYISPHNSFPKETQPTPCTPTRDYPYNYANRYDLLKHSQQDPRLFGGFGGAVHPLTVISQPSIFAAFSVASFLSLTYEAEYVDQYQLSPDYGYIGHRVGLITQDICLFNPKTCHIVVITDKAMVKILSTDPLVDNVSVMIIDEAHERTVYCDVLMSLAQHIIQKRTDFRVFIASATIAAEDFVRFMYKIGKDAPLPKLSLLRLPGKNHLVKIKNLPVPLMNQNDNQTEDDYLRDIILPTILQLMVDYAKDVSTDVMIFMKDSRQVHTFEAILKQYLAIGIELPLSESEKKEMEAWENFWARYNARCEELKLEYIQLYGEIEDNDGDDDDDQIGDNDQVRDNEQISENDQQDGHNADDIMADEDKNGEESPERTNPVNRIQWRDFLLDKLSEDFTFDDNDEVIPIDDDDNDIFEPKRRILRTDDINPVILFSEMSQASINGIVSKASANHALRQELAVLTAKKALTPEERRRKRELSKMPLQTIFISDSIGETSITLPDVSVVIDIGRVIIERFDLNRRLTVFQETYNTKDRAMQRLGRAGRTKSGHCIRLYQESDLVADNTIAEIQRVALDKVVLLICRMNIDLSSLKLIDPPKKALFSFALDQLIKYSCIEVVTADDGKKTFKVTKKGTLFHNLPSDPDVSQMLYSAAQLDSQPTMAKSVEKNKIPLIRFIENPISTNLLFMHQLNHLTKKVVWTNSSRDTIIALEQWLLDSHELKEHVPIDTIFSTRFRLPNGQSPLVPSVNESSEDSEPSTTTHILQNPNIFTNLIQNGLQICLGSLSDLIFIFFLYRIFLVFHFTKCPHYKNLEKNITKNNLDIDSLVNDNRFAQPKQLSLFKYNQWAERLSTRDGNQITLKTYYDNGHCRCKELFCIKFKLHFDVLSESNKDILTSQHDLEALDEYCSKPGNLNPKRPLHVLTSTKLTDSLHHLGPMLTFSLFSSLPHRLASPIVPRSLMLAGVVLSYRWVGRLKAGVDPGSVVGYSSHSSHGEDDKNKKNNNLKTNNFKLTYATPSIDSIISLRVSQDRNSYQVINIHPCLKTHMKLFTPEMTASFKDSLSDLTIENTGIVPSVGPMIWQHVSEQINASVRLDMKDQQEIYEKQAQKFADTTTMNDDDDTNLLDFTKAQENAALSKSLLMWSRFLAVDVRTTAIGCAVVVRNLKEYNDQCLKFIRDNIAKAPLLKNPVFYKFILNGERLYTVFIDSFFCVRALEHYDPHMNNEDQTGPANQRYSKLSTRTSTINTSHTTTFGNGAQMSSISYIPLEQAATSFINVYDSNRSLPLLGSTNRQGEPNPFHYDPCAIYSLPYPAPLTLHVPVVKNQPPQGQSSQQNQQTKSPNQQNQTKTPNQFKLEKIDSKLYFDQSTHPLEQSQWYSQEALLREQINGSAQLNNRIDILKQSNLPSTQRLPHAGVDNVGADIGIENPLPNIPHDVRDLGEKLHTKLTGPLGLLNESDTESIILSSHFVNIVQFPHGFPQRQELELHQKKMFKIGTIKRLIGELFGLIDEALVDLIETQLSATISLRELIKNFQTEQSISNTFGKFQNQNTSARYELRQFCDKFSAIADSWGLQSFLRNPNGQHQSQQLVGQYGNYQRQQQKPSPQQPQTPPHAPNKRTLPSSDSSPLPIKKLRLDSDDTYDDECDGEDSADIFSELDQLDTQLDTQLLQSSDSAQNADTIDGFLNDINDDDMERDLSGNQLPSNHPQYKFQQIHFKVKEIFLLWKKKDELVVIPPSNIITENVTQKSGRRNNLGNEATNVLIGPTLPDQTYCYHLSDYTEHTIYDHINGTLLQVCDHLHQVNKISLEDKPSQSTHTIYPNLPKCPKELFKHVIDNSFGFFSIKYDPEAQKELFRDYAEQLKALSMTDLPPPPLATNQVQTGTFYDDEYYAHQASLKRAKLTSKFPLAHLPTKFPQQSPKDDSLIFPLTLQDIQTVLDGYSSRKFFHGNSPVMRICTEYGQDIVISPEEQKHIFQLFRARTSATTAATTTTTTASQKQYKTCGPVQTTLYNTTFYPFNTEVEQIPMKPDQGGFFTPSLSIPENNVTFFLVRTLPVLFNYHKVLIQHSFPHTMSVLVKLNLRFVLPAHASLLHLKPYNPRNDTKQLDPSNSTWTTNQKSPKQTKITHVPKFFSYLELKDQDFHSLFHSPITPIQLLKETYERSVRLGHLNKDAQRDLSEVIRVWKPFLSKYYSQPIAELYVTPPARNILDRYHSSKFPFNYFQHCQSVINFPSKSPSSPSNPLFKQYSSFLSSKESASQFSELDKDIQEFFNKIPQGAKFSLDSSKLDIEAVFMDNIQEILCQPLIYFAQRNEIFSNKSSQIKSHFDVLTTLLQNWYNSIEDRLSNFSNSIQYTQASSSSTNEVLQFITQKIDQLLVGSQQQSTGPFSLQDPIGDYLSQEPLINFQPNVPLPPTHHVTNLVMSIFGPSSQNPYQLDQHIRFKIESLRQIRPNPIHELNTIIDSVLLGGEDNSSDVMQKVQELNSKWAQEWQQHNYRAQNDPKIPQLFGPDRIETPLINAYVTGIKNIHSNIDVISAGFQNLSKVCRELYTAPTPVVSTHPKRTIFGSASSFNKLSDYEIQSATTNNPVDLQSAFTMFHSRKLTIYHSELFDLEDIIMGALDGYNSSLDLNSFFAEELGNNDNMNIDNSNDDVMDDNNDIDFSKTSKQIGCPVYLDSLTTLGHQKVMNKSIYKKYGLNSASDITTTSQSFSSTTITLTSTHLPSLLSIHTSLSKRFQPRVIALGPIVSDFSWAIQFLFSKNIIHRYCADKSLVCDFITCAYDSTKTSDANNKLHTGAFFQDGDIDRPYLAGGIDRHIINRVNHNVNRNINQIKSLTFAEGDAVLILYGPQTPARDLLNLITQEVPKYASYRRLYQHLSHSLIESTMGRDAIADLTYQASKEGITINFAPKTRSLQISSVGDRPDPNLVTLYASKFDRIHENHGGFATRSHSICSLCDLDQADGNGNTTRQKMCVIQKCGHVVCQPCLWKWIQTKLTAWFNTDEYLFRRNSYRMLTKSILVHNSITLSNGQHTDGGLQQLTYLNELSGFISDNQTLTLRDPFSHVIKSPLNQHHPSHSSFTLTCPCGGKTQKLKDSLKIHTDLSIHDLSVLDDMECCGHPISLYELQSILDYEHWKKLLLLIMTEFLSPSSASAQASNSKHTSYQSHYVKRTDIPVATSSDSAYAAHDMIINPGSFYSLCPVKYAAENPPESFLDLTKHARMSTVLGESLLPRPRPAGDGNYYMAWRYQVGEKLAHCPQATCGQISPEKHQYITCTDCGNGYCNSCMVATTPLHQLFPDCLMFKYVSFYFNLYSEAVTGLLKQFHVPTHISQVVSDLLSASRHSASLFDTEDRLFTEQMEWRKKIQALLLQKGQEFVNHDFKNQSAGSWVASAPSIMSINPITSDSPVCSRFINGLFQLLPPKRSHFNYTSLLAIKPSRERPMALYPNYEAAYDTLNKFLSTNYSAPYAVGKGLITPTWSYHGSHKIEQILKDGLNPQFRGANGQVHGRGEYSSAGYEHSNVYSGGVCPVIVMLSLRVDHISSGYCYVTDNPSDFLSTYMFPVGYINIVRGHHHQYNSPPLVNKDQVLYTIEFAREHLALSQNSNFQSHHDLVKAYSAETLKKIRNDINQKANAAYRIQSTKTSWSFLMPVLNKGFDDEFEFKFDPVQATSLNLNFERLYKAYLVAPNDEALSKVKLSLMPASATKTVSFEVDFVQMTMTRADVGFTLRLIRNEPENAE